MTGKRVKKYDGKPLQVRLKADTHKKLEEIKKDFIINKSTFARKCIEFGVDNPALIIKRGA